MYCSWQPWRPGPVSLSRHEILSSWSFPWSNVTVINNFQHFCSSAFPCKQSPPCSLTAPHSPLIFILLFFKFCPIHLLLSHPSWNLNFLKQPQLWVASLREGGRERGGLKKTFSYRSSPLTDKQAILLKFSFSASLRKNCHRLFQKKIRKSTPFVHTKKKTFFSDLAGKVYIPSFRSEQGCHRTRDNKIEVYFICEGREFALKTSLKAFQYFEVFQIHHGASQRKGSWWLPPLPVSLLQD